MDSLNLAERILVAGLRLKESAIQRIDEIRPKIVFKHSIDYYRSMISAEVYVTDLLRALRPPGHVVVTY